MKTKKIVIIDFKRTLYDPDKDKLIAGARRLLQFLKDKKILIYLIGKGDYNLKVKVKELEIASFFKEMIFNENKPASLYKDVLNKTGCQKNNCLVIGDRIKEEIKTCNLLGIKTIWFKNGKYASEKPTSKNEFPTFTVCKINEINQLIVKLLSKRKMSPDLSINLCGKKLKNPLILASGILGTKAALLARIAKAGAGAVTSKSCGPFPRKGYENPVVLAWEHGLINAVGLTNPGIKKEIEEILKLKKLLRNSNCLIIASIFAPTIKEIGRLAKEITKAEPDFIEVNISCPHVDKSVKGAFHNRPEATKKIAQVVKKNTPLPIIIKLSPNVEDIALIAKAAEDGGADVVSAINTLGPGMIIDIESGKPILSNKVGGLSGPAIKPIAVKCIYQIAQAVKIPVIGMGGVTSGEDTIEMIMTGATAVGIGSGVYYRGFNVFSKIQKEMVQFMVKHQYQSLQEIKGIAHDEN